MNKTYIVNTISDKASNAIDIANNKNIKILIIENNIRIF